MTGMVARRRNSVSTELDSAFRLSLWSAQKEKGSSQVNSIAPHALQDFSQAKARVLVFLAHWAPQRQIRAHRDAEIASLGRMLQAKDWLSALIALLEPPRHPVATRSVKVVEQAPSLPVVMSSAPFAKRVTLLKVCVQLSVNVAQENSLLLTSLQKGNRVACAKRESTWTEVLAKHAPLV